MTLVPAGAQLASVDLPPPSAQADPREPATTVSRRGTRTPQRPTSPQRGSASRGASPTRRSERPLSYTSASEAPPVPSPLIGSRSGTSPSSPPSFPHTSMTGSGISTSTSTSPPMHLPNPALHGSHLSRPGSPASIHSSTSAIFERDIELPAVMSLSSHSHGQGSSSEKSLSHRPSRLNLAHGSALDHTVPAVLDDAVEALTGDTSGLQGLEIESPAPGGSNMARTSSANISLSGLPRKASSPPGGLAYGGGTSRSTSPGSVSGMASPVVMGGFAAPPGTARSPPAFSQLASHGSSVNAPSPIEQLTEEMKQVKKEQERERDGKADGQGEIGVGAGQGTGDNSGTSTIKGNHSHAQAHALEPAQTQAYNDVETTRPARPMAPQRMSTGRQVPGGWLSSWNKEEEEVDTAPTGGPTTDTSSSTAAPSSYSSGTTATAATTTSGPASPNANTHSFGLGSGVGVGHPSALPSHLTPVKDKRRISFVSPTDLLLSVPTQVTSLGEITSGNLSPDHLPGTISPTMQMSGGGGGGVSGAGVAGGRSPRLSASGGVSGPLGEGSASASGLGFLAGSGGSGGLGGLGDGIVGSGGVGGVSQDGEWEREGLGRGLEQRLEDLAARQG